MDRGLVLLLFDEAGRFRQRKALRALAEQMPALYVGLGSRIACVTKMSRM
jgi:hypothetical protein